MSLKSLETVVGTDLYKKRSCNDMGPSFFYNATDNIEGSTKLRYFPKIIGQNACNNCVIKGACLDWSEKTNEEFGMWGGIDKELKSNI